ncbi:MAG: hypothetical protein PHI97_11855 [Desulfobulbus sp.]|nr:hypothetical protein [Desulfobulbus sp.]
MSKARNTFLFFIMVAVSSYCVTSLYTLHEEKGAETLSFLADLPAPLAQAMTLEYSGIASDHLMLKALTYLGQKIISDTPTTKEEWEAIYRTLKQCTNLDPRFLDPYVLAQMTLPSDAGMVRETNVLLEKAAQLLTDDYRPHFFLWYNYFYYLNDPDTAGKHLQIAAHMPGAPNYFTTLAARMDLYAGKIYAAVIFLEETLKETSDPAMRIFFTKRLDALKRIGFLEYKIQEYKRRFNKKPTKLQDLIDSAIITKIPPDPYGGEFYIMENGRVYTTSKLVTPQTKKN